MNFLSRRAAPVAGRAFSKAARFQSSLAALKTLNVPTDRPFVVPELKYSYGDLEPVLPGQLMELHHGKHHQAYVTNLNNALGQYETAAGKNDVEAMIAAFNTVKFNAGGHVNHSIYWTNLAPVGNGGGELPEGTLKAEIEKKWGSLDKFIAEFTAKSVLVQGSGWGWLAFHPHTGIHIITSKDQDLLTTLGLTPLLAIDVWEHAYYVKYLNNRKGYLDEIWKVVNWANVQERYNDATKL